MKVNIPRPPQFWTPASLVEKLLGEGPTAQKLVGWVEQHTPDWAYDLCNAVYLRRQPKPYVYVQPHDTWHIPTTLGPILYPMLQQLKDTKQGSPKVEDAHVPEHLHSTLQPSKEPYDIDGLWHDRWTWVLDELIWLFSHNADEAEEQFYDHSGVDKTQPVNQQIKQIRIDQPGLDAYYARRKHALKLFAEYYDCLWD